MPEEKEQTIVCIDIRSGTIVTTTQEKINEMRKEVNDMISANYNKDLFDPDLFFKYL